MSRKVRDLLDANLIVELGTTKRESGRKPVLYGFNAEVGFVIGMDIGGTMTRGAIANLQGEVLNTVREETHQVDASGLIAQLSRVQRNLMASVGCGENQVSAVVIGTPGVVDPSSRAIRYCPNLRALEEPGFAEHLEHELGLSLSLYNDVNLAALGEKVKGAGRTCENAVLISIGTGFGLGLILRGEIYLGSAGRAGEFGYTPFPPGAATSLEEVVRGPALAQDHLQAGGSGRPRDAFDEAETGTEPGTRVVNDFLEHLAWALCALATLLDPEKFILAGGIGMRCAPFIPALSEKVSKLSPLQPDISMAQLGDNAGLHGALAVAVQKSESVLQQMIGGDRVRA